jgi:hypothetical protein
MTTVRVSTHAAGAAKHDCGCGCGGAGGRCCGLECLVRPNFYCGQLLSDADLSAVVQWTRDRFSLSRYRDGWGVVCGLEVTCCPPDGALGCGCRTASGSKVWINTGYAVDCCGNDLVVCEPIAVDLGSVCRPADDPCADPCFPPVTGDPLNVGSGPGKDITLDGLTIPASEQMLVDVFLRYGEQPASGQRPLFRGGCADLEACEHSRVLERPVPVLVPRPLALLSDDEDAERNEYERQLKEDLGRVVRNIVALISDPARDAILHRLATYRIYSVCFVTDYVRAQQSQLDEAMRTQIAGWLLLDWLGHALLCECQTCRTDEGVPIARLWLWRKDGRTECCRPLAVKNAAPFRRELKRDCRPAPVSKVDLARWYGKTLSEAMAALAREGVQADVDALDARAPTKSGKAAVRSPLESVKNVIFSVDPQESGVIVRAVKDVMGEPRVVAFESTALRKPVRNQSPPDPNK